MDIGYFRISSRVSYGTIVLSVPSCNMLLHSNYNIYDRRFTVDESSRDEFELLNEIFPSINIWYSNPFSVPNCLGDLQYDHLSERL